MPCDCEKKEQDDNGGNDKPKSCPDGQKFDAGAGKCVPEDTKKEQIGDPKSASTQGDLPSANPGGEGQGDNLSVVEPQACPEGHALNHSTKICEPTDQKDPGDGQTQGTDKTASIEKT